MSTFNVNAKSKWDFIHQSFTCENLESYGHVLINKHLFTIAHFTKFIMSGAQTKIIRQKIHSEETE